MWPNDSPDYFFDFVAVRSNPIQQTMIVFPAVFRWLKSVSSAKPWSSKKESRAPDTDRFQIENLFAANRVREKYQTACG